MKLTNKTKELVTNQTWNEGDFFLSHGGYLRKIAKIDGRFVIIALDNNQVLFFDAESATETMKRYNGINGKATKVKINEIIFEEVTQ